MPGDRRARAAEVWHALHASQPRSSRRQPVDRLADRPIDKQVPRGSQLVFLLDDQSISKQVADLLRPSAKRLARRNSAPHCNGAPRLGEEPKKINGTHRDSVKSNEVELKSKKIVQSLKTMEFLQKQTYEIE